MPIVQKTQENLYTDHKFLTLKHIAVIYGTMFQSSQKDLK